MVSGLRWPEWHEGWAAVKALTLWRPWPWAIFHAPAWAKRIENRPWRPWNSIIGRRIVLHAGKAFDKDSVDFILDNIAVHGTPRRLGASATDEGLIGVARVAGVVDTAEDAALKAGQGQERWFFGPYGWVLDQVRAFPEPIPCKGAQGLWDVPPWAAARVLESLR